MPFPRSLKLVTVALRVFAVLALLWSATGDPFLTVRAAEPNAGRSPEDLAELSLSDLYRYQDLAFERSGDDGFGVDTDSWGSSQDPQTFSNGDGAGEGRTLAFPVLAAACTWTGSTSADWHNSANWAGCGVSILRVFPGGSGERPMSAKRPAARRKNRKVRRCASRPGESATPCRAKKRR